MSNKVDAYHVSSKEVTSSNSTDAAIKYMDTATQEMEQIHAHVQTIISARRLDSISIECLTACSANTETESDPDPICRCTQSMVGINTALT